MMEPSNTPKRKDETVTFLKRLVMHDGLVKVFTAIERSHATSGFSPKGLVVYGESGVGKSRLIERYLKKYPATETDNHTTTPVLVVENLQNETAKGLLAQLLSNLGYYSKPRKSARELFEDLRLFLPRHGVQLIIIDEFQVLLRQATNDHSNVMQLVKRISNELGIPVVLVGTPPILDVLKVGDGQLRRRMNGAYQIKPFGFASKLEVEQFRGYVGQLQQLLPVDCITLTEDRMLCRVFLACIGVPGLLANFLECLIEQYEGRSRVTLSHLADAFDTAFVGDCAKEKVGHLDFNPFAAPFKKVETLLGGVVCA